ncbi:hypothetical protein F4815DRAFT_450849 [Daldinia loculata]|nr:hypothetical protein F4815DRAFT_450849 [Daldinia loculata]
MRSRSKICSYPKPKDGSTAIISASVSSRDDETARKSPPNLANGKDEGEQGSKENESTRCDVWHSGALGSVLVSIPPESRLDLDAASYLPISVSPLRDSGRSSAGDLHSHSNLPTCLDSYPIRGMMIKKRYISPTHWMFSLTLSPHALDWLDEQMKKQGKIWQEMMTCKLLARSIKTKRLLSWTPGRYGTYLPTKGVADALFGAYLRTFETIYRIIHIPTTKRVYNTLWESPGLASPAQVVLLQLCFAVGACFYDDVFSLRPHAHQWIREAENWLESPGKLRMTVFDIQIMCLLHLARQTAHYLRENHVWAVSGALVRAAMCVGLHRDPTRLPTMPVFETEMRRRLWTTIIELVLESSIDAAGPPMFSSDDYDCSLPLNLNDAELGDLGEDGKPTSHDTAELTDTSLQIALGRTFAMRLSVAKYSNGIKVDSSYRETLRLGSDLMAEYRSLMKYLHALNPQPTTFQKRYFELIFSRYIFSLHLHYLPRALKDPAQFHFSRTICIDTALRLTSSFLPLSSSRHNPVLIAMHSILPFESCCCDYERLLICGSALFRSVPWQAVMVIAVELAATLHEAHSTSPWTGVVSFNQKQNGSKFRNIELLTWLREGAKWTKQRIQAGHHNVKDIVYITVLLAGIEAAMDGTPAEPAMDAKGREILAEAKSILGVTAGAETTTWDTVPDLGDEGLGEVNEFWSMGFSGMEWESFF